MQICSFLPSATEILFALGLENSIAGVTFECDFPPEGGQVAIHSRKRGKNGLRIEKFPVLVLNPLGSSERSLGLRLFESVWYTCISPPGVLVGGVLSLIVSIVS